VLGNYRIDGLLGQGGMGIVYEATQLSLRRTVALKVVGADVSADAAFRERFRLEGQIQAALDHPHIVTIYEAGEFERNLFIAMRLVRGPTLKDLIVGRELDAGRALRLLAPIGDALDTAHAAGLIHRDVKPQNILVGQRDHAYLADFGLMKSAGQRGLTRTGQFVGSIDYIAPEQINGGEATRRTDVYALGAVLFEALTGIVPYPKASDAAVLYAHMTEDPPRVSDQRPELPVALDTVIAAAMAKDPEHRQSSAAALLRDAQRAFSRPTRAAMRMPGPFETPEEAGVRPPEARVSTVETDRETGWRPGRETDRQADRETASRPLRPTAAESPKSRPVGAASAQGRSGPAAAPETVADETADDHEPSPRVVTPRPPAARSRAPFGIPARGWPAIAALLLALAGGGYVSGRSLASGDAGAATRSASGALSLVLPAGWARSPVPTMPGLRFSQALAATPATPAGHGLVAGIVSEGRGRDLIPAAVAHRLSLRTGVGTPIRLGRLEGLRYSELQLGDGRTVTLYVVPTSSGAATVGCYAPAGAASARVLDSCDRSAATLRLAASQAYGLGPSRAYGERLSRILAELGRTRTAQRTLMLAARRRSTQESAAEALSDATAKAAREAAAMTVSARDREAHDALVRGLAESRDGYARMASAAQANNSADFAAAADRVRAADASTREAMTSLVKLGYRT
jgi:serine/threonine protein kinase